MNKTNIVNDCPVGINDKKANHTYSAFEKKTYYSTTTKSYRPVNILLPADYEAEKKYPVLYFLHGIFGNEDSMIGPENGAIYMPANLAQLGTVREMIIVCPNIYAQDKEGVTEGFHQEYFHGYNNFIKDLINDLMPYMEQNYSIATGRENTALCGFSMGGRTALYIGFSRPELFGYIGAFSPAPGVVPGKDSNTTHFGLFSENEFRIQNPDDTPYLTYISCGTKDSVVTTFPKSYHDILTRNNQPHVWVEVSEADHDDRAIRAGLYHFLSYASEVRNKKFS